MGIYIIENIDDLLSITKELTDNYGSRIWYRGQANSIWNITPSIQRLKLNDKETYISNDFYIKVRQVMERTPPKENYAAWMSMMQHYGLPTRLLDWSMSPLIAAFFATEKYEYQPDVDAIIWVLFPRKLNVIAGIGDFVLPNDAYTIQQLLVRAFKKDACIEEQFEDVIAACCSTENNLRMYSQQATFTVHNSLKELVALCSDDMLHKLIIPNKRRRYFYDSLGYLGINEGFIYPDMEHIANEIKSKYL